MPTGHGLSVRRAGPADVNVLAALRRAWTEEDAGGPVEDPEFESRFARWYESEGGCSWLAERDGAPVGMATLVILHRMPQPGAADRRWAYVGTVFVIPPERSAGVGRILLDEVVRWAEREGLTNLVLHPRERSIPFYERLGFRQADLLRLGLPLAR